MAAYKNRDPVFIPKIYSALREGYSASDFRADVLAGLTVAIVALPLSMALGIASGATPAAGLITVVTAGLLISLLSGSRFQIGGPAGAFVVVIYNIIVAHGYDGLVIATLMAGMILVVAGLLRWGSAIRYVPHPVIAGFTAGIAVIIFSSQIRDFFGLGIEKVPGDFMEKWALFWEKKGTATLSAAILSIVSLVAIVLLRRYAPKWPSLLMVVTGASAAAWMLDLPVTTIGSAFGGIPHALPAPHWPDAGWARMVELLPSACTIAFLAGLESLLCAVVADGMTGRQHRSNCELIAQGVANFASALFGGLPATGTIARTATNVRAGARTPVSGIFHALFVLLFMLFMAPLASYVPLAALAAILVMVAWNMFEAEKTMELLRGPRGDGFVFLITFILTVVVDLTVAIGTGLAIYAALFLYSKKAA